MASLPTAEDKAKMILKIYKDEGLRPGEVLFTGGLATKVRMSGMRPDDIPAGLQYAYDQGWIEQGPNGSHRLTEAGFAKM